jgi:hypothetical protein
LAKKVLTFGEKKKSRMSIWRIDNISVFNNNMNKFSKQIINSSLNLNIRDRINYIVRPKHKAIGVGPGSVLSHFNTDGVVELETPVRSKL